MRHVRRTGLLLWAAAFAGQHAIADIAIVPDVTGLVGNAANSEPFNSGPQRYQQVYDSYLFTPAFAGPELITQIAFRGNSFECGCSSVFSAILPDVQIDFSTTQNAAGSLSTTFADNVGPDDTVVFDGPLSLSNPVSSQIQPGVFDIVIPLHAPFLYNPNSGNLLLEVSVFEGATTVPFDAEFGYSSNGTSRIDGAIDSTTGLADSPIAGGLVTQFTFSAVPEPSYGLMLLAGLFGIAFFRCSRRNRFRRT